MNHFLTIYSKSIIFKNLIFNKPLSMNYLLHTDGKEIIFKNISFNKYVNMANMIYESRLNPLIFEDVIFK